MAAMVARVPTTILTGPLGAGKSTAILHLLRTRGDGRWAVLVNEMGDVGIDAVIAKSATDDAVAEVAGGCVCCANGLAVTVSLTRLLRRRPTRLIVEPSGLGHVAELADALTRPPLAAAVDLRAVLCVVPCDRHAELWSSSDAYKAMVHASDALIMNRRDVDAALTAAADRWAREEVYPRKAVALADRGRFDASLLDSARDAPPPPLPAAWDESDAAVETTTRPSGAARITSKRNGYAFLGFTFPTDHEPCDGAALDAALATARAVPGAERIKGVFRTTHGWSLAQWVAGDGAVQRAPIARAPDSRIQLILRGDLPPPATIDAVEACLCDALSLW